MKKLFIIMLLSIAFMLRFSTAVRVTDIFQKEVYRIKLSVEDDRIKIEKINGKFPLKNYYGKISLKENGNYDGYFIVNSLNEYDNSTFIYLDEIKSKKLKKNIFQKYLYNTFERMEYNYSYAIKNMNKAVLLGDNTRIKKDLQDKIRYIGLSHIFAMSGLHIGLVLSIFYYILKKVLKNKKIIEITLLILITLYYFSIKESPSFTRAYIMIFIYILGKILWEKVDLEKSLFISAYISIMINPIVLLSISFQLSYLAMLAIIYVYPFFKNIYFKFFTKRSKIIDYLIFTMSIQIFLIPITIYYFNVVPVLSFFSNLIILPIATYYISLNFIALFLENFYLSFILQPVIKISYFILVYFINFFSDFPYFSINYTNKNLIYLYFIVAIIIVINKIYRSCLKN